jgi:perosamine synthetase
MFRDFIYFVRNLYNASGSIPLHEPRFIGNEKKYLLECIDSNYVSSVGPFVDQFEKSIANYTGAKYAISTVNGTSALHMALLLSGVTQEDEVLTQPFSFVATSNAIKYCGSEPVFIDIDLDTLGLSPEKLSDFLSNHTFVDKEGSCINKITKKRLKACIPMHTFGHPLKIDEIKSVCDKFHIILIEDAAESLGSFYKGVHTGTSGLMGILSFNGNKSITTGGGGMILTNTESLAKKAKHLTTQAKQPHKWEYIHDSVGYNYRLTNIQAAIGVAQMENLSFFIENKRAISKKYSDFFKNSDINFIIEPINSRSNYWLNAILLTNKKTRNDFLKKTNSEGIMTRPGWELLNRLPMFQNCQIGNIENATFIANCIANIPSSVIIP